MALVLLLELGKVRGLELVQVGHLHEGGLVYLSSTLAGAMTQTKPAIEVELGQAHTLGATTMETLGVFQ